MPRLQCVIVVLYGFQTVHTERPDWRSLSSAVRIPMHPQIHSCNNRRRFRSLGRPSRSDRQRHRGRRRPARCLCRSHAYGPRSQLPQPRHPVRGSRGIPTPDLDAAQWCAPELPRRASLDGECVCQQASLHLGSVLDRTAPARPLCRSRQRLGLPRRARPDR